LIEDFERRNIPEPEGTPAGCLKYLMDEHGLVPEDLSDIGPPEIINDVIDGRIEMSKPFIIAASKRFGCSPAVFLQI
jgi:antitoxin component HigA of HigAB toxin-antitoxin module